MRIVSALNHTVPDHHIQENMAAVQRYVEIVVNTSSRHISVSELHSRENEIECTLWHSDDDIVQNIVAADGNKRSENGDKEKDCRNVGT